MAAQALDYLDALGYGRAEMADPARKVALIDVVRLHADGQELLHQLLHEHGAVIDVA